MSTTEVEVKYIHAHRNILNPNKVSRSLDAVFRDHAQESPSVLKYVDKELRNYLKFLKSDQTTVDKMTLDELMAEYAKVDDYTPSTITVGPYYDILEHTYKPICFKFRLDGSLNLNTLLDGSETDNSSEMEITPNPFKIHKSLDTIFRDYPYPKFASAEKYMTKESFARIQEYVSEELKNYLKFRRFETIKINQMTLGEMVNVYIMDTITPIHISNPRCETQEIYQPIHFVFRSDDTLQLTPLGYPKTFDAKNESPENWVNLDDSEKGGWTDLAPKYAWPPSPDGDQDMNNGRDSPEPTEEQHIEEKSVKEKDCDAENIAIWNALAPKCPWSASWDASKLESIPEPTEAESVEEESAEEESADAKNILAWNKLYPKYPWPASSELESIPESPKPTENVTEEPAKEFEGPKLSDQFMKFQMDYRFLKELDPEGNDSENLSVELIKLDHKFQLIDQLLKESFGASSVSVCAIDAMAAKILNKKLAVLDAYFDKIDNILITY